MDIRIKFISLLLSLLLISCGGGSDSGGGSTTNLDPDKIHIQIFEATDFLSDGKPLAGIVVQLDYNGENIKSDSNGIVTFSVPDNNKHDIHVFPPNNYDWQSIYNAKKGILYKFSLTNIDRVIPVPKNSFLSFSGTIDNYVPNNSYRFYFYNKNSGRAHYGFNNNTNLNSAIDYTIDFNFNLPVGSSVTGDIVIEEYQWDVDRVEKILVDSVVLPSITLNTQLTTNNVISQNIPLLAIKPQQSNILTLNNLSIPKGFTFSYFDLLSEYNGESSIPASKPFEEFYSYSNTILNLTFPKVFQSYSQYNYSSILYTANASLVLPTYNIDWYIDGITSRNTTISIKPTITVFPDFPDNQTGEEINWSKIDQKLTRLFLSVNEINPVTQQFGWFIILDPKATKVRLPQIPTGITPKLVVGQKYRISLRGRYRNGDIIESFNLTSRNSWAR